MTLLILRHVSGGGGRERERGGGGRGGGEGGGRGGGGEGIRRTLVMLMASSNCCVIKLMTADTNSKMMSGSLNYSQEMNSCNVTTISLYYYAAVHYYTQYSCHNFQPIPCRTSSFSNFSSLPHQTLERSPRLNQIIHLTLSPQTQA